MTTGRLEAFSDGVIAILITIMVLELHAPDDASLEALRDVVPQFLIYVLSFIYLAIYWNNHHHMMVLTDRINGKILWANVHLLFWLSLVPFTTAWMGATDFDPLPVVVYGVNLVLAAVVYLLLQTAIVAEQGPQSRMADAIGRDWKGKTSALLYVAGILFANVSEWIALGLYTSVALMWLVPDRRIERIVADRS